MNNLKDIVALCKRRGFIFRASDIYNGINGFWDYGPLGVELKNNIRDAWWRSMVSCPPLGPDGMPICIVGLDSSIIQNPLVWKASGHVDGFSDPMVDCRETKARYRADHITVFVPKIGEGMKFAIIEENEEFEIVKRLKKFAPKTNVENYNKISLLDLDINEYGTLVGPEASLPGTLTEPRQFNLMFETEVGAVSGPGNIAYLRPETAQGIFVNYKNVVDSTRVKMPFGIAQIGKAFRNEITPRNFIFRSREFEQMEMEWFCHPSEVQLWHKFWQEQRLQWWKDIGLSEDKIRIRNHDQDELAHYAKEGAGTVDIEYAFPFSASGFGELEGIAHRCDFDLRQHQAYSKTNLEYYDQEKEEKYLPHVIEPAAGLNRGVLAVLSEAYTEDPSRPSGVYLKLSPKIAPVKAAILPLIAKDGLPEIAQKIYMDLRKNYKVELDIKQNIGKRYARQDEIGTPFCFTIDHETIIDESVTVRHRDTMQQERIKIKELEAYLFAKIF
jgi:glycyl-tRNA synthetase